MEKAKTAQMNLKPWKDGNVVEKQMPDFHGPEYIEI